MTKKSLWPSIFASGLIWLISSALVSCTPKSPNQVAKPAPPVPSAPPEPAKPAAAPPATAPVEASPADPLAAAKPVLDLLSSLEKFDHDGRNPAQRVGFELPESAVNDYIAYVLRTRPRPGIRALHASLLPKNEIAFDAEIDLDAIAQWNSLIPAEMLKKLFQGKVTVRLNVGFEVTGGMVKLIWKDPAEPQANAIPASVMPMLLQIIGAHQPEAFDISKPIPLPFGLQRIWTDKQSLGGET